MCLVKEFQAYDSPFGDIYVAFFYCEVDGSSLCLQCDMIVHVGGKRTHGRYLLLRQRVEVCNFYTEIGISVILLLCKIPLRNILFVL